MRKRKKENLNTWFVAHLYPIMPATLYAGDESPDQIGPNVCICNTGHFLTAWPTHLSATWENIPYDVHPTKTQISLRIRAVDRMKKLCILGYSKCAQWRFWSDCANAQSDQNLRRAHMNEGTFRRWGSFMLNYALDLIRKTITLI